MTVRREASDNSGQIPGDDEAVECYGLDQKRSGVIRRTLRRAFAYWLRGAMVVYLFVVNVFGRWGPSRRSFGQDGAEILLTGTFYSDHWLATHLIPLARSRGCRRLRMVASTRVPPIEHVEAVYPPSWLSRIAGQAPARLLTFAWLGLTTRPHVVGGFHLLLNGLLAVLVARVVGARSLYICGGGPREVLGGGYATENRLFSRLGEPDVVVEKQLLRAVAACDLVIAMGTRAVDFYRERAPQTTYHIVPGGFSGAVFFPSSSQPTSDLILVGRLSAVKRVDLFLRAILAIREELPEVSAIVVGDGPVRSEMEQLSADLRLEGCVRFVGYRDDSHAWLRKARVFVLTSDSEGLSQAMIQAMMCGLPVVVSQVGDLADLVQDDVNGYLVSERTPEAFARCIRRLLVDPVHWRRCSMAAIQTASRFEIQHVSLQWDGILGVGPGHPAVRTTIGEREAVIANPPSGNHVG